MNHYDYYRADDNMITEDIAEMMNNASQSIGFHIHLHNPHNLETELKDNYYTNREIRDVFTSLNDWFHEYDNNNEMRRVEHYPGYNIDLLQHLEDKYYDLAYDDEYEEDADSDGDDDLDADLE